MKRLTSFILCFLLIVSMAPGALADDVIEISDAQGLLAIPAAPYGSYRLTDDIDMSGVDWKPIAFYGTLDGQGHTIYNLNVSRIGEETEITYDGNLKQYATYFSGLFSTLKQGTVQNLNLVGLNVNVEPDGHCFAAGIAGFTESAVIKNCTVDGRIYLYGHNVMVGVGGIVGFGCATINDCTANVELFFEDRNHTGIKCEEFMGGIISCGVANVSRCTVNIDGWDSCNGYVHNGGICGMYYYCGHPNFVGQYITDNTINGTITFYENNYDRRAYCAAVCGETLWAAQVISGNVDNFKRNEVFDYSKVLTPEKCETPEYVDEVFDGGCTQWSHMTHTCAACGYSYSDGYTPPHHEPGDLTVVESPDYDKEGLKISVCKYCGLIMAEEHMPALVRTQAIRLSAEELKLHYKQSFTVDAYVSPSDAFDSSLSFSSSDESVVTVDAGGRLYAAGPGSAVISCEAEDGGATAQCRVTVDYSPMQLFIRYVLFGWLWY